MPAAATGDRTGASSEPLLCVDLDGTLTTRDTLAISLRVLLSRKPWLAPRLAWALAHGRASLKTAVSEFLVPAPTELEWRSEVLEFLGTERARGRRIALVTAAHRRVAQRVAEYLGLFDHVLATDDRENLKARRKLAAIRKLCGDREFDYIGDSAADFAILCAARRAYLVAPSRRLIKRLQGVARVERVFHAV